MREEFPDATHHCWAYVAGPPGNTAGIGMSDAGEPHGTAGRPMLDVLLHCGVGEIAAVVTRFYGGVKLGTGGLVKAYSSSVQQAAASLPTTRLVQRIRMQITAGYADVDALRRALLDFDVDLVAEEYGETVAYTVAVPVHHADRFITSVTDRTAGRAELRKESGE